MALLPVQGSPLVMGEKFARMTIGTLDSRMLPQIPAANLNAFRRCSPSVVPGLPPSGAAGVGSLKPSPAASLFWMVIVTPANALDVARRKAREARNSVLRMVIITAPPACPAPDGSAAA